VVTSRFRRFALPASAFLALAGAAACAGILGIDPVSFDPVGEAGATDAPDDTPGNEAGADAPLVDGGGLEASPFDAPLPDAACVPCGTSSAPPDPCGIVCDAPTNSEFLEVGNGFAFFGSRTKLERVGLDGSGRTTIAIAAPGEIGGFAFYPSTNTIAWTVPSANEIHIRSGNGAPAGELKFVTQQNGSLRAKHLVLTASDVVYFEGSDPPGVGGGQGWACSISMGNCNARVNVFPGDAPEEIVAAAGGATYLGWRTRRLVTASDAGSVFVATAANPSAAFPVKSGGLTTMDFMPVAVDETGHAYWTELNGATTSVYMRDNGPAAAIAVGGPGPPVASIAVSGGFVYLTKPGAQPADYAGEIIRANAAIPLYKGRPNPGRIVQNVGGIYWIDRGNPPQTPSLVMRGEP
jgi:hypothetical protein